MTQELSDAAPPASGRALLIDPSVYGQSHILVNTGFIDIALSLYKNVTVVARDNHIDALIQYMDAGRAGRVDFIRYANRDAVLSLYRSKTQARYYDLILFLNIEHDIYYKINTLNAVKGRRPLYWVGHSHFMSFDDHGITSTIKNQLKKILLFNPVFKSKIVVCGSNIKSNVNRLIHHGDKVKAVFHPVGIAPFTDADRDALSSLDVVSLLHINGWHQPGARKVAAIEAIKAIASHSQSLDFTDVKSSVATDQDERYFSRDYRDRLDIVSDYSFFLHLPENRYRLQASGALMDMLLTGTPVIGLKTDFGEEMATLIGSFGYFFESYDDIVSFLEKAESAKLLADHALFLDNLKSGYAKVKAASLQQAKAAFI